MDLSLEQSTRKFESEAELAYKNHDEILEAAHWCIGNYPHSFDWLNDIYLSLTQEYRSLVKYGLQDWWHKQELVVSNFLTVSQSLRLLECYKRFQLDDKECWNIKNEPHKPALIRIQQIERSKQMVINVQKALKELCHRK